MSDLVGNHEDLFSRNEASIRWVNSFSADFIVLIDHLVDSTCGSEFSFTAL